MGGEGGRVLVPQEQGCSVCLKTQREPPRLGPGASATFICSVAPVSWTGPGTLLGPILNEQTNERTNEGTLAH